MPNRRPTQDWRLPEGGIHDVRLEGRPDDSSVATFAVPAGIALMAWLLTAYDTWAELTKAQRLALEKGTGTSRPIAKLAELGLWADGKPTVWAQFVMASRRRDTLNRWTTDDDGALYWIKDGDDA